MIYKIFQNTITQSFVISEQGSSLSLKAFKNAQLDDGRIDNRYYDGHTQDTGFALELAQKIELCKCNDTCYRFFLDDACLGGGGEVLQGTSLKDLKDGFKVREYRGGLIGVIRANADAPILEKY
jgi:hypothetical protein